MRFFVFLGSLLVLALAAALIVPPYVDWNQFRDHFEKQASGILGQPVKVGGETKVRLLPLPSVTFTDIQVGAVTDGRHMLEAENFHINVELAPLLKGDFVIVDMAMENPKLDMRVDKNGQLEWSAPTITVGQDVKSDDIALQNIVIKNGLIRVRDERLKQEFIIREIGATASAQTLAGPWRASGQITYQGQKTRLSVSTGRWQNSGQVRIKVAAKPKNLPYDMDFDGPFLLKKGVPSFDGKLRIRPLGKQSDTDKVAFRRPDASTALPFTWEGDLKLASRGAFVPAYKLDIGDRDDPYTITGTIQADFAQTLSFSATADGQQVNLERIESKSAEKQTVALSLKERIAKIQSVIEQFPRFEADGEIELKLPAVVAGDTVIRDVSVGLKPLAKGQGWQLKDLAAQLPGRTDVRANGALTFGETLAFDGDLIVASKQPSGLASWLGTKATQTLRELSSAGFSAKSKIDGKSVRLTDLEIAMDGASLTGHLIREVGEGEKPKLDVDLKGDAVDFDQLTALFELFSNDTESSALAAHDLKLALNADQLRLFGVMAEKVDASLSIKANEIKIDQLSVKSLAGAELTLQGAVADFSNKPTGKLTGSLRAKNPSRLISLINKRVVKYPFLQRFADDPYLTRNSDLKFSLNGAENGIQLQMNGNMGGGSIDLSAKTPALNDDILTSLIDTKLVLVNDNLSDILLQLGIPVVPLDQTPKAAFRITGKGQLSDEMVVETALTMGNGYLSAQGPIKLSFDGEKISSNGSLVISGEAPNLDPMILMSGLPLPGLGQSLSGEIKAELTLAGDNYTAKNLKWRFGDTSMAGELSFQATVEPRPRVEGMLTSDRIDAADLISLVFNGGAIDIPATGLRDSDGQEIGNDAQPVFAGIDADIAITVKKVELPEPFRPLDQQLSNASAQLKLRDGDISLEGLEGKFANGKLTADIELAQTSIARLISGNFSVVQADLDVFAKLFGFPGLGIGQISMQSNLESAGKDNAGLISGLTGSGFVQVTQAALKGLDHAALARLLKRADEKDETPSTGEIATMIQDEIYQKEFPFGNSETGFSIASGVLRAPNVKMTSQKANLSANVKIDLSSQAVESDGRLTFDAGPEAVIGAVPELTVKFAGTPGEMTRVQDQALFATYLGLRVSERREREFEAQRSTILENQRLVRTARLYVLKEQAKQFALEEQERLENLKREQEELRKREEARRKREEIARAQLNAKIEAAEKLAAQAAAEEAGRRAKRQEEIELLIKKSREAIEQFNPGVVN